jgi:hypothetical protein
MRPRKVILLALLGSLAVGAAPAQAATNGTVTSLGKPDLVHHRQRLTESISGRPVGEVDYATYREVDPSKLKSLDGLCPKTMATNLDARVFGPVVLHKSKFSASVLVNLQEFLTCEYVSDGSLAPAAAELRSYAIVGQYYPGAPLTPTKPTKVTLTARRVGADEVLTGTATGPAAGILAVQLRSGRSWASVASLTLTHGKFSGKVLADAGQQLRVVRLPTTGWRAGSSKTVRVS